MDITEEPTRVVIPKLIIHLSSPFLVYFVDPDIMETSDVLLQDVELSCLNVHQELHESFYFVIVNNLVVNSDDESKGIV